MPVSVANAARTVALVAGLLAAMPAPVVVPRADAETKAQTGAAFRLFDQDGRTFTTDDLVGKPTVLHFGFTHCPVICPTTLYEISERLADLGPLADRIRFVFVTVDPARDSQDVLKAYIESFDSRIVGLTGSDADIRRLADRVGARYEKVPNKDGGYDMDHTVEAFLLDHRGERSAVLHVGFGADPGRTMKALRALIAAAPAR